MKVRTSRLALLPALFLPLSLLAQAPPPAMAGPPPEMKHTTGGMMGHPPMPMGGGMGWQRKGELGAWWKDSELVKKLQLSDAQVKQLNQTFLEHRLKLIDYGAEMEKQDLKLQTLLDEDSPSETQVGAQVDQVLAARGKLERESTMMNLDLRKVLSVEQWRQLKSIREDRGPRDHVFFHKMPGPGAGPVTMPMPPGGGPGAMPGPPSGPEGPELF